MFVWQLTNREYASVTWAAVFFVFVIRKKSVRLSILKLFRRLANPKIILILSAFSFWVFLMHAFFCNLGIWRTTNLKVSVYWFFGSALVLLFQIPKLQSGSILFRKIASMNFGLTILLEYIIQLYEFSYFAEIVSIFCVSMAVLLISLPDYKKKYQKVNKLLQFMLAMYGMVLLYLSIRYVVFVNGMPSSDLLLNFFLPIILTSAAIPFLYFLALFISYEQINFQIRYASSSKALQNRAILRIAQTFHFRLSALRQWRQRAGLLKISTPDDIETILKR